MPNDDGAYFVFNKTKETFLAYRVRAADSVWSRLIGLIGKRGLEPDGGLWIVPSCGVHTFGMLFTIDVVFLDKDLRVVGLCELLKPFWLTRLVLRAESVLELPPHTIFRSGTELNDELVISSSESVLSLEGERTGQASGSDVLQRLVSAG